MIRCEIFSETTISEFIKFSKLVYEDGSVVTNFELVRNKHLLNPDGKSLLYQMSENNIVTGRLAVVYRRGANRYSNECLKNPVDLVSIGKHPFGGINLYRASLKTESGDNLEGVFHTSNPKSEIFYRKILKEVPIAELSYRAIPLSLPKSKSFLTLINQVLFFPQNLLSTVLEVGARFSSIQIQFVEEFENDQIKALISDTEGFVLQRDSERLAWRFPRFDESANYKKMQFFKNGKIQGYLVLRSIESKGYSAAAVVDFYFLDLTLFDRCKVYKKIIRSCKDKNLIFVIANFHNRKIKKLFRFPFVSVPKKFIPQEFPVYSPSSNKVSWINKFSYLTLFDFDVM